MDGQVGHSDPPRFLREARQWMQRWLKGDPTPLPEETTSPAKEKPEDLACLLQLPADAINYRIQNQFTTPVSLKGAASRAAWARRRAELLAQLKDKVFRWFPSERIPFETQVLRGNGGYMPKHADYREVSFQSEMGVLALYAGLFDERIKQVILNDPPASHGHGPALLNVLRVTDIPEVAGAFAPRRLVSLRKLPEPFRYAQSIYRREGASTRFVQAGSLPEALEVWSQRSDRPTLDPTRKP